MLEKSLFVSEELNKEYHLYYWHQVIISESTEGIHTDDVVVLKSPVSILISYR